MFIDKAYQMMTQKRSPAFLPDFRARHPSKIEGPGVLMCRRHFFTEKERKDGVYKEISVDELGPPCYIIILRGYAEYLRHHIPGKDL